MSQPDDYKDVTPLEWAMYEFATIQYDHDLSEEVSIAIENIFKRLANETSD